MPTKTTSYTNSKGHAFYKHTGGYNEVTLEAKNKVKNDAPSALHQKNLAPKGDKSAAASTLKTAWKELGW